MIDMVNLNMKNEWKQKTVEEYWRISMESADA